MKRIYGLLVYLLWLVLISGCAGKADTLSVQDFWNEEETDDNDTMEFVTGLEIIFPKEWRGNIVIDTDIGSYSNTISICEKKNSEAGIGGAIFYLQLFEYIENEDIYMINGLDKVLGRYRQGSQKPRSKLTGHQTCSTAEHNASKGRYGI